MKICVVTSSTEGIASPFSKYDKSPDPQWYITKTRHEFFIRPVSKENAKQDIDRLCEEGKEQGWNLYMNYMWGSKKDEAAGVEATKYMESKNVPILTNQSRFLEKTKLDLNEAGKKFKFLVPGNTPERYPKIVKYADGYAEPRSEEKLVCLTKEETEKQVALKKDRCKHLEVMVQDYITGTTCSVIVIEMGRGVTALTPIQQVFPGETPDNEAFLTWDGKFENIEKGTVTYEFVEEDPTLTSLKEVAILAFKGMEGYRNGWARVDIRLEASTGLLYVIDVHSVPLIFFPLGDALGDDLIISHRYPGGQPAFFDTLLATRQIQRGELGRRNARVAAIYDGNAEHYDYLIRRGDINFFSFREVLISKFDFSGTVLDVACGSGFFGELLHKNGVEAEITGIELSTGMLRFPAIKKNYKYPIMLATEHDHIVCFGGFHFLDRIHFNAVLSRMFMLARKSITFEIDDIDEAYIAGVKEKYGEQCYNGNNVEAIQVFSTPHGWRKVFEERKEVFMSHIDGTEVWGIYYRYESTSFFSGEDMWPIGT
ncbi:putative 2-c-methyl-d-erythritol -cyclodiphosphate synthase [Golovinomyces cichoracearum]|uniref:Putative 2-c-methyl-d-erythritol-cyclodiphosphate synthase n=1 Tax=Golovinomyces cichoracearum TaxID=62708 RepID=A0A420HH56_9PEZI|nr:putative 2-c-methyl-d-erythritol -cyclodiphosphate synthase [Golovinomyces cichoracearum]